MTFNPIIVSYIDSICKKYNIKNYTINSDGTVDVDGDVNLYKKGLTELPLRFGKVTRSLNCASNNLETLEGSPHWVGIDFECRDNRLTSLKGSPQYVGKDFSCSVNRLNTLECGPNVVLGSYWCNDNIIINFKGFPEDFDLLSYINFNKNPVNVLLKDIPDDKINKFIYWCNEYDAITDNGWIIHERMEEAYNKIGLEYEQY